MKPEAQRIAIAEACGWRKDVKCVDDNEEPTMGWRIPGDKSGAAWGDDYLPDYLNSLDAMATAESRIFVKAAYLKKLHEVVWNDCGGNNPVYECASAAQRAKAFLLSHNLWRDDA